MSQPPHEGDGQRSDDRQGGRNKTFPWVELGALGALLGGFAEAVNAVGLGASEAAFRAALATALAIAAAAMVIVAPAVRRHRRARLLPLLAMLVSAADFFVVAVYLWSGRADAVIVLPLLAGGTATWIFYVRMWHIDLSPNVPGPIVMFAVRALEAMAADMRRCGAPFGRVAETLRTGGVAAAEASVITTLSALGLTTAALFFFVTNVSGPRMKPPSGTHVEAIFIQPHGARGKQQAADTDLDHHIPPVARHRAAGDAPATTTPGTISWARACGFGAPLPGFDAAPIASAIFLQLYIGSGAPGAVEAGCTTTTGRVPGHRRTLYEVGLGPSGGIRSIAAVWPEAGDRYAGVLYLAPACAAVFRLLVQYGAAPGSQRLTVGNGDMYLVWVRSGTIAFVRSVVWRGLSPAPYLEVPPAVVDAWVVAMRLHGEWLWPEVSPAGHGELVYRLVHDPVTHYEVDSVSYRVHSHVALLQSSHDRFAEDGTRISAREMSTLALTAR